MPEIDWILVRIEGEKFPVWVTTKKKPKSMHFQNKRSKSKMSNQYFIIKVENVHLKYSNQNNKKCTLPHGCWDLI